MEAQNKIQKMLDLLDRPGFCTVDSRITHLNSSAQALLLEPGADATALLHTGQEEYAAFREGCLYLQLQLPGGLRNACVTRAEDMNVFLLDREEDEQELRSLALAARELREPLSNVMITSEYLLSHGGSDTPEYRDQAARLNRGLMQLLRIVGNMSDAAVSRSSFQQTRNITALMAEIFHKAQAYTNRTGIALCYEGPAEDIFGLVDETQLERAVLNILSNAVKFTPQGGSITACMTRQGRMLRLCITDSGSGIADAVLSNVFRRHLRKNAIEDRRNGIGLGMVLVRTAAADHGGTVLIDKPKGCGTRVTMTLAIRQDEGCILRSDVRILASSGWDNALVELSDCLPPEIYEKF